MQDAIEVWVLVKEIRLPGELGRELVACKTIQMSMIVNTLTSEILGRRIFELELELLDVRKVLRLLLFVDPLK